MAKINDALFTVTFTCPECKEEVVGRRGASKYFDRWDFDVMLTYRGYEASGAEVELGDGRVSCPKCHTQHTVIIREEL
jgi:predicted RNA-binding Zn-ribbon protein involved in translation (DUF1610 family)